MCLQTGRFDLSSGKAQSSDVTWRKDGSAQEKMWSGDNEEEDTFLPVGQCLLALMNGSSQEP